MSPRFSTKKAQSGQLIQLEKVERNVRYGSLADRLTSPRHVRFLPITDVGRHIQVSIWLCLLAGAPHTADVSYRPRRLS
jgi:hypothetical protein